ncbi:MAG TPA: DUF4419 domain-containing protein [Candidatus Saccharimonadales bacterium]|nr:DUF4419 domain-containing protein [Candidatus Saccharimonadales bacterium]
MSTIIDIRQTRWDRKHYGDPEANVVTESNEGFLTAVLGTPQRLHYTSRDKLAVAYVDEYGRNEASYGVPTTSLLVQTVHGCFAAHQPLSLRPDSVWYMVIHQVAEHVRQNADHYAHLFTDTPGKQQELVVRDHGQGWDRIIPLFEARLRERIGDRMVDRFLPRFSTTTDEDAVATLVAFMDAVSPYYKFTVETLCHIPQVRLEGTAEDWQRLYDGVDELGKHIDRLSGYFAGLLPVLQKIAQRAAGSIDWDDEEEFWPSLYKFMEGSGDDAVSGWINAFFAYLYTKDGPKLKSEFGWRLYSTIEVPTNQFPSHVSAVPFEYKIGELTIDMTFAGGIIGVDHHETFLVPRLGFAVAER